MSWYKTGTVSVVLNSNAVIGTGTAFIANCRVGDGFRGPDGSWYEVTNIASDTAMSIAPNFQGVTAAAGSYALAPMQGYVKDSADVLRAVVNQFGETLAVLGTSGSVSGIKADLGLASTDGMPEGVINQYFTESRAIATPLTGLDTATAAPVAATDSVLVASGKLQAQVSAAMPKSGGTLTGPINDAPTQTAVSAATVNIGTAASNVIAISGTTTITGLGTIAAGARRTVRFLGALVLTHNATSLILPTSANITTSANDTAEFLSLGGGSWICLRYDSANGKPAAFAYDRANLLGAVSQTGGIPTGSAFQYSANANGICLKFADGTMITAGRQACTISSWTGLGSGFWYSPKIGAFPMPGTFIMPPICTMTLADLSSVSWCSVNAVATVNTYPDFYIVCALNVVPATMYMDFIAYGRWY